MPTRLPPHIPGLTGIEHIGLTVPSLDEATEFFTTVLGAEPLYDIGPFATSDDWMANHLAGHPRARLHRMRLLKLANGPSLELIELKTGSGDVRGGGGWHMAFYVEDMETALAAVKAHACVIQSGPVTMTEGPAAGLEWLYFQAPWGQQLELVSYPGGIAAYRERAGDVWRAGTSGNRAR